MNLKRAWVAVQEDEDEIWGAKSFFKNVFCYEANLTHNAYHLFSISFQANDDYCLRNNVFKLCTNIPVKKYLIARKKMCLTTHSKLLLLSL